MFELAVVDLVSVVRPRTHHALDARTRPQALESSTPAE
jgi:hypothetical protein